MGAGRGRRDGILGEIRLVVGGGGECLCLTFEVTIHERLASLVVLALLLMGLGKGDIDGTGLALLAEVLVGHRGLRHSEAGTVLPDETSVALNGEAIVIVAATDAANDACFLVDGALVVIILCSLVVWKDGIGSGVVGCRTGLSC